MEIMDDVTAKLIKWADGKTDVPQRVLMYPTNVCNLKCVFCYQQLEPYDYSDKMSKAKWLEITEELCEMGVSTLQISGGGESLVEYGTVIEMMRIIKKHNIEGRLVNNGTLWNEKRVHEVVETGWDNVIFSVDGPDAETNDFHRGVDGTFKKIKESLLAFQRIKEEKGKERPLIEFSSVLTGKNYEKVGGVIELAKETGVKVITFEPVFVSNPYVHEIKMSEKDRERFMAEIIPPALKMADDLDIITNLETLIDVGKIEKTGDLKEEILDLSNPINEEDEGKEHHGTDGHDMEDENPFLGLVCYEPWLWPKIEANGEVGPCSSNILSKENIKDKTFRQVWEGEAFSNFRKAIMEKKLPDGCANCVSTHVPMNKRIRANLIKAMESRQNERS